MKQLRKFLSLTASERLLLIKAAILLVIIKVGIKLLPFHQLRSLLAKIAQPRAKLHRADETFVNKVVWAVIVASPYLQARCLTQALATQVLLGRRGYPSQLRIGFTRNKERQMSAHAWIENQGQVVIGGAGHMTRYILVPLPEVESDQSSSWHLFT